MTSEIILGAIGGALIAYGFTRRTITKSEFNELFERNVISSEGWMCIGIGSLLLLSVIL